MPLFIQGGSLGRIVTVLLGIETSAAFRILLVNFSTQSSLDKFSISQRECSIVKSVQDVRLQNNRFRSPFRTCLSIPGLSVIIHRYFLDFTSDGNVNIAANTTCPYLSSSEMLFIIFGN